MDLYTKGYLVGPHAIEDSKECLAGLHIDVL